jgi:hypothetical protein
MKLFISGQSEQNSIDHRRADNEVLRLAAEMVENTGLWPSVDVPRACIDHWNGRKIAINREELNDLQKLGLIEDDGRWTDFGCRELSRMAGISTHDMSSLKVVRG